MRVRIAMDYDLPAKVCQLPAKRAPQSTATGSQQFERHNSAAALTSIWNWQGATSNPLA
jgi:hypothetical protein